MPFRYPDKPTETTPDFFKNRDDLAQWICQDKYDGWRLVIHIDEDNVRLLTREKNPIERVYQKFPSYLRDQIKSLNLNPGTVLDSELVGPRGSHSPAIYIFDMLAIDGKWLVTEPFVNRWKRCEQISTTQDVHLSNTIYPSNKGNVILDRFNLLRSQWLEKGKPLEFLVEGVVVKFASGKLRLNYSKCITTTDSVKIKFRDIRDSKW